MSVAEVGAELWEAAFDIKSGAIPTNEGVNGESVPGVVQAWPT
jgi:hypothetical protein